MYASHPLTHTYSQAGVPDMVHLLCKIQDSTQDSTVQLSTAHRVSLHAITAGLLYLLSHISSVPALGDHVEEIIERRRELAPMLLPDHLFRGKEKEEGEEGEGADGAEGRDLPTHVAEDLLFQLRERGLVRQSPEPVMDPTSRRCESSITSYSGHSKYSTPLYNFS